MTTEELMSKLAEALEVAPSDLRDDSSPKSIPSWNSMADLEIISLLGDATQEEISAEEAEGFTSIRAIVDFARSKGILTG